MNGDVGVLGKAGELLSGVSTGVLPAEDMLTLKFRVGAGRPLRSNSLKDDGGDDE